MPLSSISTTAEVLAAYADNASYEQNDSLSQARAFASACRVLLSPAHTLARSAAGGRAFGAESEVEMDQGTLERQLEAARQFIAAKQAATGSGSGAITHVDMSAFRS